MNRRPSIVFAIVVTAGVLLRVVPLFNDFWYDEIAALYFSKAIGTPLHMFSWGLTGANHPLYTIYMSILGEGRRAEVYRLFSLATGILSMGGMYLAARPYGRSEARAAVAAGSLSYFLIHYSSEARGYSPAVFFALAAFFFARRFRERADRTSCSLFWLSTILGMLSHLSFLMVLAGFWAWEGARLFRSGGEFEEEAAGTLKLLFVPSIFLLGLVPLLARHDVSEGFLFPSSLVVLETVSAVFGLPMIPGLAAVVGIGAGAIASLEVYRLYREGDDSFAFFSVTVLAAPASLVLLFGDKGLYPRYFLVSLPFLLLLLGRGAARVARRGRAGRGIVVLFAFLYLVGNGWWTAGFLKHGRGSYLRPLKFMAAETMGEVVTIGSNHDPRNALVIAFFQANLDSRKILRYVKESVHQESAAMPEWFIDYALERVPEGKPRELEMPNGERYRLAREYPFSGVSGSGFWWYIYRKASVAAPSVYYKDEIPGEGRPR